MNKYGWMLVGAGLCEVGWAIGLKHAETAGEWLLTAAGIALSFAGLMAASSRIAVGTAYAIFTGIGAAGTAVAGSLLFGEPLSVVKLTLILILIAAIVGLKLTSHESPAANKEAN